ncbi:eugenol synthase 1-like isoform X2 [Corylus avellana]|uniref:eugenol synthase 1-like isoform X2 n=1 Tax=Corylus avellana TaxID=13451 RepID=UPI00286AED5C|nr:eugenol synthase 1-like isoform X2 [Corylus avellana]
MENEKRKIMIVGGTGYIGNHLAKASLLLGHPTYVYARPITPRTTPSKVELRKELQSMGATFVLGEVEEHEKIVSALREVDIVISALAYPQVLDQLKIIDAIKVAGNIKRFLPSDFGVEEDRITPLPPFEAFLEKKRKIRRIIEAAGIPYTFVSANCFGSYFLNYLLHPHEKGDDIAVYGSGEAKAVLNYEEDIAMYTIKVATDPRTCNRVVIYRPPKNILSQLELITLWQKKTGRSFNKVHVLEEEIVKLSRTVPPPNDIPISILHSIFIKGQTVFELGEEDMEASRLYPDYEYTTVHQLLDIFLVNPPKPAAAAFA